MLHGTWLPRAVRGCSAHVAPTKTLPGMHIFMATRSSHLPQVEGNEGLGAVGMAEGRLEDEVIAGQLSTRHSNALDSLIY